MPERLVEDNPRDRPSLRDALVFRAKATLLQMNRAARNALSRDAARHPLREELAGEAVAGRSETRLWTADDDAERHLLAGKVHNLRLAIRRLNGVEVPAGAVFSFWAQVGRPARRRGYVAGRELREGCIIPTVGGGLCQLSNALYDAALNAGFEIIERHAHTQVIPGSLAEVGRDATVFWNYVDLRFKSAHPFRVEAAMDANVLTVRFKSSAARAGRPARPALKTLAVAPASHAPNSCVTCNVHECFRHVGPSKTEFGRAAYLVDEFYPEFDGYISSARREPDLLAVPLEGKRFGKANYAWSTEGFRHVRQSRAATLLRAYQSRRLAAQGAARQRALLAHSERLARSYGPLLEYDVTHVTLSQNLLPYLWRDGHLGGRTFDVLMNTLPLARLHERLDGASALHPESQTLADFRADEWLVRAEAEALRHARRIVTPHTEIAALYGDKATLLDWATPPSANKMRPTLNAAAGTKVAFPAPTAGRKGAYELRDAVRGSGVRLVLLGAQLEGPDFWQGVPVEHRAGGGDWLEGVGLVVLPAFVEHKPRRLLEALARGVPVVASTACGLENVEGVVSVPFGDVEALRAEIIKMVASPAHETV
jgi:hypothetical protein